MQPMRAALAARSAGAALLALLALAAPAAAHSGAADERLLIPSASWHGRPIQEPHRHEAVRKASVVDAPRRWSAGAVSIGTGFHRAGGSVRVREVQKRLRRLGYRPGPIDGLFGPRTRASVAWFQVKHGLPVDGRATLATVRHLRARTGAGFGHQPRSDAERPTGPQAQLAPSSSGERLGSGSAPVLDDGRIAMLSLLLLVLGLAAAATLRRRRRRAASSADPRPLKRAMLGDVPPVEPARPHGRVLAYVLIPADEADDVSYRDHAAAIETECAEQGLALAGLISDVEDHRLSWQRPGLATAVNRLVTGDVDFLMVTRLDDPAGSGADLRRLVKAAENEIAIARWKLEPVGGSSHERERTDG